MFGSELYNLPMVISLNKSDFESIQEIKDHEFIQGININQFKYISANKTVAIEGKGILDAFYLLVKLIFPNLKIKKS